LDQFLELLAWFEAWGKWFVVGWVVLPLRFDLSQAFCVCAWWFSRSARGFLLCWCDSCVIQESFVVFLHILEV